tara:strand:- start:375 stop:2408 length:2034 start_codon:yes stop_codon:yes gene_type:complete
MFLYRREIDGLRSIAVIPVLFFHAGFSLFSGGFIGVDIFFVISGYLITSIILTENSNGTFTFSSFYKRRARRLLPALFLVIFACIPMAWLLMPPSAYENFSLSIVSVILFFSNFWFYSQSGYFTITSEEMPLLHTWSLAVEEQFYIFFPLFLTLFIYFGKKWLFLFSLILFFLSLFLSQFGENLSFSYPFYDKELRFNAIPDFSFYLAPTRFFELLVGCFCAYFLFYSKKDFSSDLLAFFGVAILFLCIVFYDEKTNFPGFMALIPVIATAMIILFCSKKTTLGKFLGNKILVYIGLISYSAYLWHQPLFSFSRLASLNEPNKLFFLLLIFLSFFLAFVTYKIVENPLRKKINISISRYFYVATLILIIGVSGYLSNGFSLRFDDSMNEKMNASKDLARLSPPYLCHQKFMENINICEFGKRVQDKTLKKEVLLLGNSHARMLIPELDRVFKKENLKGIHPAKISSCKYDIPFRSIYTSEEEHKKCLSDWTIMLDKISSENTPVIISHRLTSYITGEYFKNPEGYIEQGYDKNYKNYSTQEEDLIATNVKKVLELISNKYKNVILLYPIPEVGFSVPKALFLEERINKKISYSTGFEDFNKRNSISINILDNLSHKDKMYRIRPSNKLCNIQEIGRCSIINKNGLPFYYDSNHLSPIGSRLFSEEIINFLNKSFKDD